MIHGILTRMLQLLAFISCYARRHKLHQLFIEAQTKQSVHLTCSTCVPPDSSFEASSFPQLVLYPTSSNNKPWARTPLTVSIAMCPLRS